MSPLNECICAEVRLNGRSIGRNRNWNADCPAHGVHSDWFKSAEQIHRRAEQDTKLRLLQRLAHETRARAAGHPLPDEAPIELLRERKELLGLSDAQIGIIEQRRQDVENGERTHILGGNQ